MVIRRDALQAAIAELVPGSPWAQTVARLRCLRGIDTLSAVGLCAEVGDFERFERAGRLMSYVGLVPSENCSGETRRQGAITKTGSRHARRLLVEAAWHYRKRPARGKALERRQEGQPAHVIAISWQAQQRLFRVWRRLDGERGKRRTIVAVAVARELAGFCWALARHAAPTDMEVAVSSGRRWLASWALGVGWCGPGFPGRRERAQLFGGDARLIFEGWVPHDPVFVAVRGLEAGAASGRSVGGCP